MCKCKPNSSYLQVFSQLAARTGLALLKRPKWGGKIIITLKKVKVIPFFSSKTINSSSNTHILILTLKTTDP